MNNHYTPLSFNAMLAACVGFRAVARFVFFFFIFCAGQSFNHFLLLKTFLRNIWFVRLLYLHLHYKIKNKTK